MIVQSRSNHGQQEEAVKDKAGGDELRKCLDLAVAGQKAVLRTMVDETGKVRAPYHWAGFFLQGCWNKLPTLKGLE